MRIPTVGFELGVLLQATGVLGLLGVPVVRISPATGPPAISSLSTTLPLRSFSASAVEITTPSSATTTVDGPSSSGSFSATASTSRNITDKARSTFLKRAAIPACLKTVELSCLNLAANCIDTVNSGTVNNLWGIKSCVAAATCYGNYVDFYYGELTTATIFPVIALWNAIVAWAATGSTVPYLNFNDWLHFSSFPSTTTTTAPPIASYTEIYWNPNPAPPSGAVSETFVQSSTTVIIAIPTTTTTVVIGGASITLAPGVITLPICGITKQNNNVITNPSAVSLGAGTYYSIGLKAAGGVNTVLNSIVVGGRPVGNGPATVNQEHVFELGYIKQFFEALNGNGIPCAGTVLILDNVYNRAGWDGATPWALSLLLDIDQVGNMVWVDKPLNQVKCREPGQADRGRPPSAQSNMNNIADVTPGGTSVNVIQDVEYFARNFAALGGYFGATAATFRATALRVQNRLAQITPDTPAVNLPVQFNNWLRDLAATYPAGCTSRANNVFNYYANKMTTVANLGNNGVVPQCFPLYHTGITAQSFTWQKFIPPAPTLPLCNIPGTQGKIHFGQNPGGNPELSFSTFRILGSGRTDFYALGLGADFAGEHFIAEDLTTLYSACSGTGNQVTAPITFVVNNQVLDCVTINSELPGNAGITIYIICAGSNAAATTCGNGILQTDPQGHFLTGTLQFSTAAAADTSNKLRKERKLFQMQAKHNKEVAEQLRTQLKEISTWNAKSGGYQRLKFEIVGEIKHEILIEDLGAEEEETSTWAPDELIEALLAISKEEVESIAGKPCDEL
ncbi:hypothetical protein B0H14DRAFT_3476798 [Mycena olivaceomarginata]|nr:hypothetical protein B0H14DRAFT_3476798 [Mycena olivaceomarginata]